MMETIPAVELLDDSGEPVSTAGLGPAVLFFFPRANTSGCTTEAKDFSRLAERFASLGVRLIGVSKDAPAALARFRAKQGLTVGLWSDGQSDLSDRLGIWKEKSLYGKRFMGIERTTLLVDQAGRVVRRWAKVRVSGHADAVLAAAEAMWAVGG